MEGQGWVSQSQGNVIISWDRNKKLFHFKIGEFLKAVWNAGFQLFTFNKALSQSVAMHSPYSLHTRLAVTQHRNSTTYLPSNFPLAWVAAVRHIMTEISKLFYKNLKKVQIYPCNVKYVCQLSRYCQLWHSLSSIYELPI